MGCDRPSGGDAVRDGLRYAVVARQVVAYGDVADDLAGGGDHGGVSVALDLVVSDLLCGCDVAVELRSKF